MNRVQSALAWTGLGALVLTFGSTLFSIWIGAGPTENLLKFTDLLLSWKIIGGGFVFGGGQALIRELGLQLNRTEGGQGGPGPVK